LFSSESVTEGHPDKIADQISDAVLDAMLALDKDSHVACETLVTTNLAVIAGEITSQGFGKVAVPELARNVIKRIGYTDPEIGFDYKTCSLVTFLHGQSPDIARGVVRKKKEDQGAGDQGMMFGYATDETPEFMPMPIMFAHRLTGKLAQVRHKGILKFLRPDGKSQVSVRYVDGLPKEVTTIVIAAQHTPEVNNKTIEEGVMEEVVKKVIPAKLLAKNVRYYINPTGRFERGGPHGDTGLTGRKIIVDTYGGMGRHGGGAFSGKDPSKVDRSAAYMARYVAKNIVAAKLAQRCEVQLAYAIGVAEPVSIMVEVHTYGTSKVSDTVISKAVRKVFQLRPWQIIQHLDLLRPIYEKTAANGHFGRSDKEFTWEKTDMVKALRKELGV
jgi:S-adenosylmethionine synthetase